jgi:release factor glutamine methyltransferase
MRRFWGALEERAAGSPLQYLLGETEFYSRRFTVAPGVFIPRPETEAVVEAALARLRDLEVRRRRPLRLVEFGVGSGCIAVTLACELPTCLLVGVELSWDALRAARENAARHGCAARVRLVQGWWANAVSGTCDGILANPPYVPTALVEQLPVDVRHEPRLSLDGGPDGMRDLSQLVTEVPRLLSPGGVLVLECGEDQAAPLAGELRAKHWVDFVEVIHDVAGRPRGIVGIRAAS